MPTENTNEPLSKAGVKYQLAIDALEAIIDPIGYMKSQLKEDEQLNGMGAIMIADKPQFYQEIARKALSQIANCT
jgi:hypothetical protein